MALSFGRRLFCRDRSAENDTSSPPMEDGTHFAVEVDIPAQAVERLAGTARKNQLKNETGANMTLYTPKMNGELPFVRLWGSADQVESAFECVCDDAASVDIRFARRMKVRSILVAESRQVGWIKGTNGVKLENIQKKTNTIVDVEPFRTEKSTQNITITGAVMDVYTAFEKIQESVASYDPERAKKPDNEIAEKREEERMNSLGKQLSETILECVRQTSNASAYSDSAEVEPVSNIQKQQSTEKKKHGDGERAPEHIQCDFTIEARPVLFACLLGKSQENINKIRSSTDASIEIGYKNQRMEFQDVYIKGEADSALKAAQAVKSSFERFDPEHPASRKKIEEGSLDPKTLKQMKGRASIILAKSLVGYFVGKQHFNIGRIKNEAKVDELSVCEVENAAHKRIEIVGSLDSVIVALEKSVEWIKKFKPKAIYAEDKQRQQKKNESGQDRPTHPNDNEQAERSNQKRNREPGQAIARGTVSTPQQQQAHAQAVKRIPVNSQTTPTDNSVNAKKQPPPGFSGTIQQQPLVTPTPQLQQLPGHVLMQQPLQTTNAPQAFVLVPVSATNQEQMPVQQAYIVQAAPADPQQPCRTVQPGQPVQIIQNVPGEMIAPNIPTQKSGVMVFMQPVPPAPPRVEKRPPPQQPFRRPS